MTEAEHIEAARDKFRKAEALWKDAIADVMAVVKINADAGRAEMANAAFGVAADFTEGLGDMMRRHFRGTSVLLEKWPNWAADLVTRGPPR